MLRLHQKTPACCHAGEPNSRPLFAMQFEHHIDINLFEDDQPKQVLTREQVWQGLCLRVWCPQRLPNGPSACDCVVADLPSKDAQNLSRTLQYGALTFRDTVTVWEKSTVQFRPEAHDETAPIGLTITLTEPALGQPCLSFLYEALAPMSQEEALYNRYRQNAWRHADHDMVDTWRSWLAQGVWPADGV